MTNESPTYYDQNKERQISYWAIEFTKAFKLGRGKEVEATFYNWLTEKYKGEALFIAKNIEDIAKKVFDKSVELHKRRLSEHGTTVRESVSQTHNPEVQNSYTPERVASYIVSPVQFEDLEYILKTTVSLLLTGDEVASEPYKNQGMMALVGVLKFSGHFGEFIKDVRLHYLSLSTQSQPNH